MAIETPEMESAAVVAPRKTMVRRGRVSPQLEREVGAQGVSQAIVFLGPPPATAGAALAVEDDLASLATCFVKDERSITASLMSAGASLAASLTRGTRGAPKRGRRRAAAARDYAAVPAMRRFPALGIVLGDVHADGLEALANNPRVTYVASSLALSLIRPTAEAAAALPSDATTWGIDRLDIPKLWAAGLTGKGVKVGHLDTGVDGTHPTLKTAVGAFLMTDFDGFPLENAVAPFDTGRHGTHTAATIAGRPVNGRHVGVAPDAMLYSATVIEGGNVVARILAGLNWAATNGVKVISMSLGLRGYHDDFLELMRSIRDAGILPIIASGNEGPGTSRSPGNYDIVLSVGASDGNDEIADFSSSQAFDRPADPLVPDLVAPGVDVVSAKAGGGYLSMSGTSMATPHVAGLAALLWQARPNATPAEIEAALLRSCVLGTMPRDRANRGLPNGPRAYELLTGNALLAPEAPRARAPRRAKSPARRKSPVERKPPAKRKVQRGARTLATARKRKRGGR